jgi:hypothetical protein
VYEYKGKTEGELGDTGIAIGLDAHFKANEEFAFAVLTASSDVTPGAKALVGGGVKSASMRSRWRWARKGVGASGAIGCPNLEAVN